MRALERNYAHFEAENTVVLGLSIDPQPAKSAWAKALCLEKLSILSDFSPLGKVSQAYGNFLGDLGFSGRANVLIDEEGQVIWSKQYEIGVLPEIEEILAQL
jgi:peroxiredoxin